jgi:thiamine biosynthesis lipoprotein
VLAWSVDARRHTRGAVDVTLLDARLATEAGTAWPMARSTVAWSLRRSAATRRAEVTRQGRIRFDLDGVAKGWIADRALAHLSAYPAALVDADGDIAIAVAQPSDWAIDVDDPDRPGEALASVALGCVGRRTVGVATSGIDVHRWGQGVDRHHIIDPATARSARSDLRQCTVVADSAALAEAVAKALLIRGSEAGAELVGQPGVLGALLLHRSGEVTATQEAVEWLA